MSIRYYKCEVCKQSTSENNLKYCNCGVVACDNGCADKINLIPDKGCD